MYEHKGIPNRGRRDDSSIRGGRLIKNQARCHATIDLLRRMSQRRGKSSRTEERDDHRRPFRRHQRKSRNKRLPTWKKTITGRIFNRQREFLRCEIEKEGQSPGYAARRVPTRHAKHNARPGNGFKVSIGVVATGNRVPGEKERVFSRNRRVSDCRGLSVKDPRVRASSAQSRHSGNTN